LIIRLTVRQLSGLIKEAIEEAHDDMSFEFNPADDRGQMHHGKSGSRSPTPKMLRLAKKAIRDLQSKDADEVIDDLRMSVAGAMRAMPFFIQTFYL